jgi:hypothetical protein
VGRQGAEIDTGTSGCLSEGKSATSIGIDEVPQQYYYCTRNLRQQSLQETSGLSWSLPIQGASLLGCFINSRWSVPGLLQGEQGFFWGGVGMEELQDYFRCSACQGKDFKVVYHFSLRFHGVNFSDDLIYDRLSEEIYQCANCKKTFKKRDIDDGLTDLIQKRKRS